MSTSRRISRDSSTIVDPSTPHDSFADVFAVNAILLRLAGVLGGNSTTRRLLLAVSLLSLTTYTLAYGREFASRAADGLDAALELFTLLISLAGGEARYAILLVSRPRFRRMLRLGEDLWSGLDRDERLRLRRHADRTRRLTWFYLAGCAVTIFLYVLGNLLTIVNDSHPGDNLTSVRRLPYAFVVEVSESPVFEIVYVYQVLSMIDVGLVCIAADTVGPVFIVLACGHFEVVRRRLANIAEDEDARVYDAEMASKESTKFCSKSAVDMTHTSKKNTVKELKNCIRYHQTILELCEDIEKLTNMIFLTQLFGSTYNISLVGFKLAGNDPDKMKYIAQVSIAVMQLFLCNWPPDLLATEGEAVINAAYSTCWHQFPVHLRKSVYMMIVRAQRPIRLTAGNIVALSLETFASMVSSAASFFTVIRNMN